MANHSFSGPQVFSFGAQRMDRWITQQIVVGPWLDSHLGHFYHFNSATVPIFFLRKHGYLIKYFTAKSQITAPKWTKANVEQLKK